jgi:uncharacterized protein (TIGR02145 family)
MKYLFICLLFFTGIAQAQILPIGLLQNKASLQKFYQDSDGDGFGDINSTVDAASAPTGYVDDNTDCDDTDPAVNPDADEIPNDGKDNNCDGVELILASDEVYNATTKKVWKDRNLGATQVATSSTDASSYGDLYQWGRGADGHQSRTSSTTSIQAITDSPGHGDFITQSDWRNPINKDLWQGVSGVNNPCPSGFRLPTQEEFAAEIATWASANPAGSFGSNLKLPLGGRRETNASATFTSLDSKGLYWTSSVSGNKGVALNIESDQVIFKNENMGFGRSVRCIKDALVTVATVSDAPNIGTATAGDTEATVTFTAPASDGGAAITGYTVTSSPGGITATGAGSPITITGLTNGTAYTFSVTATNSVGTGAASAASNAVTPAAPATAPDAPEAPGIGIASAGDGEATVAFTAPTSDGGETITEYTVTSSPGGVTATGTSSPITITGLTNGTAYTFTVTATNSVGTGAASTPSNSVTPVAATVPDAPSIGKATAGDTEATVTFTSPASDGGSAITTYTVTSSTGGITATGASSPITITGLTNGTAYTFTVTATNSVGTGAASGLSNSVTPATVSSSPQTVTSSTGRVWMDRNLGASQVATSSTDADAYGDLYQWGRGTDGHQSRTSTTTAIQATTDSPGHGDFITNADSWRNPDNLNLWQGVAGGNNPCPSGFRVPTRAEFVAEIATWDTQDAAGAISSSLKFPLVGIRNNKNALISNEGTTGLYWVSDIVGAKANGINIESAAIVEKSALARSFGRAVRCIQDNTPD